ncbi:MAG: hypothetical protein QW548_02695 [Candidatus Aenigmatarchaeota archaeon]
MKPAKAGEYAALLCIIVAVLAGLVTPWLSATTAAYIAVLLVVLGIVIGLTTISEKEVTAFLITTIVFVAAKAASPFGVVDVVASPVGTILNAIVNNVAVFVLPAALIVGFKAVYALASRK